MADVKWIKITTDIFDDEKILLIESLPEADAIIVVWFKLLCLAGKQNNSGVFMLNDTIPYTDEMLATIFRRKTSTVRLALDTFERFGMIEVIDGVITIPKWGKHQSLEKLENRKEYMRNYMKEYRAKQTAMIDEQEGKSLRKSLRKQEVNPQEEDVEEEQEKKKSKKKRYDTDEALNDAILAFIEHRKKLRRPMTEHVIELFLKKLNGLSEDNDEKIQIINEAMEHGWQTVYPLKGRREGTDWSKV